ncbi:MULTISPECIES: hypothetical protein [Bacteria]|uniref:Uncharacterized protein n=1 Tax=Leifsonia shinshuensis TaxID=150026 RepID=A0A853CRD8_9MICO|nr:hypothetical protein [Leifsonia shinshuensis]NYJ21774.1 hypothetical protein [Leifsonia shinshuensis]
MNLIFNLLGLLGLIFIALLGIAASGYLAARRMREAQEPEPSTDPTERNQES